jgi:capsule polysaccharide export protein KpsE/RkpR
MLPKQFLVDDLGLELAHTLAQLQTLRRRMDATDRTMETHRKRIDALRKRVERSAAREQKRREEQR